MIIKFINNQLTIDGEGLEIELENANVENVKQLFKIENSIMIKLGIKDNNVIVTNFHFKSKNNNNI